MFFPKQKRDQLYEIRRLMTRHFFVADIIDDYQ